MSNQFSKLFSELQARSNAGDYAEELVALKEKLTRKPIVLFGVGFFGAVIVQNFHSYDISIECFCDNYKTGIDPETRLPIISPDELVKQYRNANIIISVAAPETQRIIHRQLIQMGFAETQIFPFDVPYKFFRKSRVAMVHLTLDEVCSHLEGYEWAFNFFQDSHSQKIVLDRIKGYLFNELFAYDTTQSMYFPMEISLSQDEVFIDAGLYIGDTTREFLHHVNGQYKKIIGFDIDNENIKIAEKNLADVQHLEIINKGLWDTSGTRKAELGLLAESNLCGENGVQVPLVSLDEMFRDVPPNMYPTFIKMDIEGSEVQALQGTETIIRTAKPKLAICVYHKPEDIYLIPQILSGLNHEYKFMLKHYSPYTWDTVLYAF